MSHSVKTFSKDEWHTHTHTHTCTEKYFLDLCGQGHKYLTQALSPTDFTNALYLTGYDQHYFLIPDVSQREMPGELNNFGFYQCVCAKILTLN